MRCEATRRRHFRKHRSTRERGDSKPTDCCSMTDRKGADAARDGCKQSSPKCRSSRSVATGQVWASGNTTGATATASEEDEEEPKTTLVPSESESSSRPLPLPLPPPPPPPRKVKRWRLLPPAPRLRFRSTTRRRSASVAVGTGMCRRRLAGKPPDDKTERTAE